MRAALLLLGLLAAGGCTTVRLGPVMGTAEPATVPAAEVAAGDALVPVVDPSGAAGARRWGYADARTGRWAIRPQFDEAQAFSEGRAAVRVGRAWGYIGPGGAWVAEPAYDAAAAFTNGRARVVAEGRTGLLDAAGAEVVRPSLNDALDAAGPPEALRIAARAPVAQAPFGLPLYFLPTLSPWLVLDGAGAVVAELPQASELRGFGDAGGGRLLAPVRVSRGVPGVLGRWGFVDAAGEVVVPPRFEGAGRFYEGRVRVVAGGRVGYADAAGALAVAARWDDGRRFAEGLAAVREGDRWGFVRPDGTVAVTPQFDAALDASEGLAAVRVGGLWGYVRADGPDAGTLAVAPRFLQATPFRGGVARVLDADGPAAIDAAGTVLWRDPR